MKCNITTGWLFKKGFRYVMGRWVKRGRLGDRRVRVVLTRDENTPANHPGMWSGLSIEKLGVECFDKLFYRQHVNAVLRFAMSTGAD